MAGECILVVEDQPLNMKLILFLLTSQGYDVRTATNAGETMSALETFLPRLILMDIQLPGMDGLELTRCLRADPRMHAVVIIAVTAYAMKGDEQKARDAGCDGYITKPIDTRMVLALISDLLRNGSSPPLAA